MSSLLRLEYNTLTHDFFSLLLLESFLVFFYKQLFLHSMVESKDEPLHQQHHFDFILCQHLQLSSSYHVVLVLYNGAGSGRVFERESHGTESQNSC